MRSRLITIIARILAGTMFICAPVSKILLLLICLVAVFLLIGRVKPMAAYARLHRIMSSW
jgi:hypothetical protein